MNLKEYAQTDDIFVSGHNACPGCTAAIAARAIGKVFGKNSIIYIPACCFTIVSSTLPFNTWNMPFLYSAFENSGACISGIKAALNSIDKNNDTTVFTYSGDGAAVDIGIASLSGAAERNEDVVYVCYNNEAYMNTGSQRSAATTLGAITTTTILGKKEMKKNIDEIMRAHDIPYQATLSPSHPMDFIKKLKKAKSIKGFRFLHILCPCPSGWKFDPGISIEVARDAVESGMWVLYEVENGIKKITYTPKKLYPVKNYLLKQGRFRHLKDDKNIIRKLQLDCCKRIKDSYGREIEICKVEDVEVDDRQEMSNGDAFGI